METSLHTLETARWHALLTCAESSARLQPTRAQEQFIVALLMRFSRLGGAGVGSLVRNLELRLREWPGKAEDAMATGEQCLFVCGLYPELTHGRHMPLDGVAALGRGAFRLAGERGNSLAAELAGEFGSLCRLLHVLRELEPGGRIQLDPISAYELYLATGSVCAAVALRRHTRGPAQPVVGSGAGNAVH